MFHSAEINHSHGIASGIATKTSMAHSLLVCMVYRISSDCSIVMFQPAEFSTESCVRDDMECYPISRFLERSKVRLTHWKDTRAWSVRQAQSIIDGEAHSTQPAPDDDGHPATEW